MADTIDLDNLEALARAAAEEQADEDNQIANRDHIDVSTEARAALLDALPGDVVIALIAWLRAADALAKAVAAFDGTEGVACMEYPRMCQPDAPELVMCAGCKIMKALAAWEAVNGGGA